MTVDLDAVKIYIRSGATDLRKAANGLTVLAGPTEAGLAIRERISVLQQGTKTTESGVVGQDGFLASPEAT
jgi:hypothetical protein